MVHVSFEGDIEAYDQKPFLAFLIFCLWHTSDSIFCQCMYLYGQVQLFHFVLHHFILVADFLIFLDSYGNAICKPLNFIVKIHDHCSEDTTIFYA